MRADSARDLGIAKCGHFRVSHCVDCLLPGYLLVSPIEPVSSLAALDRRAQAELGSVLATATEAIRSVVAPPKIYCAQFGEENPQLHFHLFPRTEAVTAEYLRAFPAQQNLIHGPVLLDWARSRYRAAEPEVWAAVAPTVRALRAEFARITNQSART